MLVPCLSLHKSDLCISHSLPHIRMVCVCFPFFLLDRMIRSCRRPGLSENGLTTRIDKRDYASFSVGILQCRLKRKISPDLHLVDLLHASAKSWKPQERETGLNLGIVVRLAILPLLLLLLCLPPLILPLFLLLLLLFLHCFCVVLAC